MPPGGPGECEVYDGEGNRVSETAGGVTTKYLVDTLNPTHLPQVLDETVNGSVTRTYAHGLQRQRKPARRQHLDAALLWLRRPRQCAPCLACPAVLSARTYNPFTIH